MKFQSWIVNFRVGVCAKSEESRARIAVDQEIKATSSLKTSSIQNQLREKISLIMKNWIWWWRQNWNGATTLLIWSTKLPSVEPWQDKKGEKLLHRVAEDNWILFKKRHLQFSPHACHGTPWDCVERSGRRREVSPGKGIPFSTEKRKNRLTWKAQTVWRLVLRLEFKIPCLWRSRWKRSSCDYRHHPVCRGYKSRNRCIYGHRCLFRHADGERKPQREFEKKKVLKEQVRLWEEKTSKVVYLKTQIQRILFHGKWKNWDWTLRRDTPWNSWDASGTNQNSGKKRAIWTNYPKRRTSWAKSLRAQFWGTNTWGNLTTSRWWQQSSVEFVEKNVQCWAGEIWAQIKSILCGEDPETIWRYWPWIEKCK